MHSQIIHSLYERSEIWILFVKFIFCYTCIELTFILFHVLAFERFSWLYIFNFWEAFLHYLFSNLISLKNLFFFIRFFIIWFLFFWHSKTNNIFSRIEVKFKIALLLYPTTMLSAGFCSSFISIVKINTKRS